MLAFLSLVYNMAAREYKSVVVTPAGRRAYLEILVKHLAKQKHAFDEWHLWKNTNNFDDIVCLNELASTHPWIKVIEAPNSNPNAGNFNIHRFFEFTRDPNTIYIRLDDDIVWLDDNFIAELYEARLKYPSYFLVYPQIINNGIVCHLQQRAGVFEYPTFVEYACTGNAWADPAISQALHLQFLDAIEQGTHSNWRNCFTQWIAVLNERISINSLAFFGKTFANINVGPDEEDWLSCAYPRENKLRNIIVGGPMCVHYAFYTQRPTLDQNPSILDRYRAIASS
jgi:hypothetical protein